MKKDAEVFVVHDYVKLALAQDGNDVLVLGYRVELTDGEREIVKTLLEAARPMHKSELSHLAKIAENSLAVHIANINKKALPITGRKLLVGNRQGEYKVSDNI